MGIIVHSLFWVMQDLHHQPYLPNPLAGKSGVWTGRSDWGAFSSLLNLTFGYASSLWMLGGHLIWRFRTGGCPGWQDLCVCVCVCVLLLMITACGVFGTHGYLGAQDTSVLIVCFPAFEDSS